MHEFETGERTHRRNPPAAPGTGTPGPARPDASRTGDQRMPLSPASILGLQRTAGNASVVQLLGADEEQTSPVHDVVGKGGGAPLDDGVRSDMEGRFGQSFSDVRVHTDAKASESAESVGANAYTVGNDIVFRSGHFDASSPVGQRTLAHELTHVVQQRSGPVDGSPAPGGISLSNPTDRFEQAADRHADQVMSGAAPAGLEESEDSIQRVVQRDAAEDELEDEAV
ncbi:MAG TPA: DUF4157 domain-containing protein [Candidatus Limnocylindrales bacterium]|nr:DUF4157 domain-containing protein [Candidatus Limnocylindrales bacterium]